MSLFEKMEKINPDRNPVFTAIENLKTPEDIKQFSLDYEEYLISHSNDEICGREREVARSNIGYILGYYSDDVMKLWYKNLPNVFHPVFGSDFGRTKTVTPQEAFNAGVKFAKEKR